MIITVAPGDKEWLGFEVLDLDAGETITDIVWAIPEGLTKLAEGQEGNVIAIQLSGFTVGSTKRLWAKIKTTKSDREINRFLDIVVNPLSGNRAY
jgi:hypothetical protein